MVTRVLVASQAVLGIPTNWKTEELSDTTRGKYKFFDMKATGASLFNTAIGELWQDDKNRSYIMNHVDTRDTNHRRSWLASAKLELRRIWNWTKAHTEDLNMFVYHRSMPFGGAPRYKMGTHMPFVEDLVELAAGLPVPAQAHLVLVIRSQPAAWLSHASADDYRPF
eukprot:CAMPEP_0197698556 /NCGR_PEP_ID=MMETSP1338-20131121/119488_1 /TAXON_ID=43686 ORGANISM="Pelagodinium beii, Strain RCC1491" /NCGR_SAMPLE_ID=MMETSP1338 /ASSEMBLY_ACC=CAM_ASM_000754 /LENGTH=166 /DNA_ID=CAMNT_0043281965 /DNA_START=15 /DNA_END=512 /DNA_ORIENTATION=+